MSVWDVPDERIDELGARVGALDFVTHCYHRPRQLPAWPYSLFAMVHGISRGEVRAKVAAIAELLGADCRAHDVLFSTAILIDRDPQEDGPPARRLKRLPRARA